MKAPRLLIALCFVSAAAACGGGSGDPAASGTAAASAGSAAASSSSSKVVPHEKLADLLPNIPGFKRESDVQGTTDTSENVSRVQLNYIQEGGIAGLSVEMMDVAGNSIMLAPLREQLKIQGTRHSAANTTEKATSVQGYPAVEEWTPEVNNGSVSVLIADRFVVKVEGSSVGKADVIYKAFDSIDLKKIAALK